MPLLEARGLVKSFRGRRVVDGVELDVEDSESNDEFNHQYDGLLLYLNLVY